MPVKYLLAGSSGFLGTALRVKLAEEGHSVVRLVRREPATAMEYRWDPERGELDPGVLDGVDVVVNLAGVGVADRPWTKARKEAILSSRVDSASTLAKALARRATDAQPVFLQASATGWYGTQGRGHPLSEDDSAAEDWLAQVVARWEAAAQPAGDAGLRVVFLRTAPVMDRRGGPLKLLRLPFRMGLGATLGDGRQHMAMVGLTDWLRAVLWLVERPDASGPYNLTIPQPPTNAEFTTALAAALHRPVVLRAPSAPLRRVLGPLADQLLGDQEIVPARLEAEGFTFQAPDVRSVLDQALARG